MLLHLHRPAPPLDRFVEMVTYYADYRPDHAREKLLPDGAVEIIVDLTGWPKRLYDRDDAARWVAFQGTWISGMRRKWIVIEASQGASMVVVRFRPGGAFPFLGFAVEGITETVENLATVIGRAGVSLRDRILEAPDIPSKMAAVEAWLIERAGSRLAPHPVIEYVTGRLFAPAGIRIADVIDEVGYSQRHVSGLFRRWVGLPPKPFGRIRRFQQVLASIAPEASADELALQLKGRAPAEPDWADMAATHGYFDQSHLVRDFQEFAGLTPSAYIAAYRGLANYLPMD